MLAVLIGLGLLIILIKQQDSEKKSRTSPFGRNFPKTKTSSVSTALSAMDSASSVIIKAKK